MHFAFDDMTYWLEQIARPDLWRDYLIPAAGIVATVFLGWAAVAAARAANRIAKQNTDLALRAERRRFGDAVIAYYESRHDDVRTGKNWNMPHWTESAEAIAAEVAQPNSDRLLSWVTGTIDHATNDGDPNNRDINALHIRATVPVVVARWVNNPAAFDERPFVLWEERPAAQHDPGAK
ncbi:hypothetical protein [Microbacterium sp. UCD-TDU]|uniref:hypothetical protein n=1 Tax=Microbacterium sp. UCD-TDU TaxID=1247714 RepID=UPI000379FAB3|nr:hypothetical protein [Microbacterium sp. UCD-TDU]EYT59767.1 hypothetical protein D514_0111750 [Microbacterium sp. UCD-TDU]